MKNVIFYIREIMAMGLSQAGIEKQTGIKQSTISYLLSGHLSSDVRVSTLESLRKLYQKMKRKQRQKEQE